MTDADAAARSVGVGVVGAVVVAAGSGTRLGADRPKAFVEVDGEPILWHALAGVHRVEAVSRLVVVVPADLVEETQRLVALSFSCPCQDLTVVAGGAERTDSVRAGLAALGDDVDIVLVHDAARCLTPTAVFERVIAAIDQGYAGAVPGVAVVDTVKVVDASGVITETPDRASLRAIQTPQGFRGEVLRAAYDSAVLATDDAALVEAAGHDVVVVEGDSRAFKITTPDDVERAERMARAMEESS